jgi:hypothetical protein
MVFCPLRFSAGSLVKMAKFRTHDATVTGGKGSEALIAVTLSEALFGRPATGHTFDAAGKVQPDSVPEAFVERNFSLSDP